MFLAMSKARADLVSLVHAQQYQKQQENSTAILTRSCKFGMTIRKEARSLSTDNNPSVSLDSAQPPSTQTPVPSTDYRSPWSTDNTNLLSTDILHPTDIPSQTSIYTEPRDMVAPLILVRDNNGDLHDQEGHLRNAAEDRAEEEEVNYIGGAGFQGSGNQGGNRNSYENKSNFNQNSQFCGNRNSHCRFPFK
ncbi:hypothetical protein DY000_02033091 [Brassica cretica]|uniref:DUF4005 domain-containing protein n=1 Tax=Brassica cretica TaxID=69181 RepID=A0ABQ7DZ30_BRACR|nr:hypothetical protein DY000_02033091 [Brassica cretica]